MKPIPSAIFDKLSHVDLRVLLLLCGLIISVLSVRSDFLSKIDNHFFQLSSYLIPPPKGAADIAIITVPDEEVDMWHDDIHEAGKLGALLSNILHASTTTIGILLDKPLNVAKSRSDQLLEKMLADAKKSSSKTLTSARELVQRKQFLLDFLRDDRVVIGVSNNSFNTKNIVSEAGALKPWPNFLLAWFWPETYDGASAVTNNDGVSVLEYFPVIASNSFGERQLVYGNARQELHGTFFTEYLAVSTNIAAGGKADSELVWGEDVGLQYASQQLQASPEGKFKGAYGVTTRMAPLISVFTMEEAFARGAFPGHVFITSESNPAARVIATDFFSSMNQQTIHKPWWLPLLQRGLLLVSTLYLCFLLPRISFTAGAFSTVIVLMLLVIAQVVTAVTHKWYLAFSINIFWLLAGHVAIAIWMQRRDRLKSLTSRADTAALMHADMLIQKAQYAQAEKILRKCRTSSEVLEKLYDIARAYSERRQYKSAVYTLRSIVRRSKGYKDTEQKIQALQAMVETQGGNSTLVKSAKLEASSILGLPKVDRPVLGRYKVQEELGRGAMGVVYLGFDPKISRKVAIKTFHYSQFQPNQVEDLKARFYREAEAAGRLNHPGIVSVFDVGEEDDLAFIAMDFASGKSLSAFTSDASLLPVFEVYRIICDVAQALDYAHSNQIVHRDIKPGNIMYSPSPYQVKVTDFGIARLVDDSRTNTGEILGSPLYMSPEQLKGKKVTGASDVFSLGVTFYQLLTGALPFLGENLAALTYEIIHGKHKGVRSVRKDLPMSASRIINQCLQKSPEDRYGSAGELALVLKKAIRRDFAQSAKKVGYF